MSQGAAERERGTEAQQIARELELDVLLLAGADDRSHEGALRWAGDYNPARRYGEVVVAPGVGPELLLRLNLGIARRGGGVPVRFAPDLRSGIPERLRELGPMRRIEEGMGLPNHPHVVHEGGRTIAHTADTSIFQGDGGEALSSQPHDLVRVQ